MSYTSPFPSAACSLVILLLLQSAIVSFGAPISNGAAMKSTLAYADDTSRVLSGQGMGRLRARRRRLVQDLASGFNKSQVWDMTKILVPNDDEGESGNEFLVVEGNNILSYFQYASHQSEGIIGSPQRIEFYTADQTPINSAPQQIRISYDNLLGGKLGSVCTIAVHHATGDRVEYRMDRLIDAFGLELRANEEEQSQHFYYDINGRPILDGNKCLLLSSCFQAPLESLIFRYQQDIPIANAGTSQDPADCSVQQGQPQGFSRRDGISARFSSSGDLTPKPTLSLLEANEDSTKNSVAPTNVSIRSQEGEQTEITKEAVNSPSFSAEPTPLFIGVSVCFGLCFVLCAVSFWLDRRKRREAYQLSLITKPEKGESAPESLGEIRITAASSNSEACLSLYYVQGSRV